MKQRFLSLCAIAAIVSLAACTNDSNTPSATNDTGNTANSTANNTTASNTSTGSYAAMSADSLRINTAAGYYVNPRTGKPYKSLTLDETTGGITDETGAPVWRYVDNRSWWVYGYNEPTDTASSMGTWGQSGQAQMKEDKITYQGDGDQWVDYDTRWKTSDEEMNKKWKSKDGKIKIKTEKDGDMKIKVGDEKIKVDEDGVKKKD